VSFAGMDRDVDRVQIFQEEEEQNGPLSGKKGSFSRGNDITAQGKSGLPEERLKRVSILYLWPEENGGRCQPFYAFHEPKGNNILFGKGVSQRAVDGGVEDHHLKGGSLKGGLIPAEEKSRT